MRSMQKTPVKCKDETLEIKEAEAGLRRALSRVVRLRVGSRASFEQIEQATLEVANECSRRVLEEQLQRVADRQPQIFRFNGVKYRPHQPGEVRYHSLCGALEVRRWSYRRIGVRNGPTLIPVEIVCGLLERATPAFAYCVASGYAKTTSRDIQEDLLAARRCPPSRTSLERIATRLAAGVRESIDEIEPALRMTEELPNGAYAISLGLDRTTVPMAEAREAGQPPNSRRKGRKTPYLRTPPPPIDVNYRMAYVGTVSITDKNGDSLQTYAYAAAAHEGPCDVMARLMADLRNALQQDSNLHVGVVQDGAPEMWGEMWEALAKEPLVTRYHQAIDRYHLNERLSIGLEAIERCPEKRRRKLAEWNHQLDRKNAAILHIIRELRARYTHKLTAARRKKLWSCLDYIEGHENRMRYARLRKLGLPVGSGATEGACKSLIAARTKRSGQRWSEQGITAVLGLRSVHQCGRLEDFWTRFSTWKTCADLVAQ